MPTILISALLLPAGLILFGVLMLRQPLDPRAKWDYRRFGGRLAIIAGVGGLIIGLVRVASGA